MINKFSMQILFISNFIKIILGDTKKVNDRLECYNLQGQVIYSDELEEVVFKVVLGDKGYDLFINGERILSFGNKVVFNKRTINELQVWFHKKCRQDYNTTVASINQLIGKMEITSLFDKFTFTERLLGGSKEFNVTTGSVYLDSVINVHVSLKRTVFNKFKAVITTSTEKPCGLLGKLYPTHCGVIRQFGGSINSDPVNQWFREVLHDHITWYVK